MRKSQFKWLIPIRLIFERVSLFGISLAISELFNRGDDHSINGLQDHARIFGVAERRLNGFLIARRRVI
jgi:hypothetical protein